MSNNNTIQNFHPLQPAEAVNSVAPENLPKNETPSSPEKPISQVERAENKDLQKQVQPFLLPQRPQVQVQNARPVQAQSQQVHANLPLVGYKVASNMANSDYLKKNRGKGDPAKTSTWVLWLADRLLKKGTLSD